MRYLLERHDERQVVAIDRLGGVFRLWNHLV
jgi:hypothetical protein